MSLTQFCKTSKTRIQTVVTVSKAKYAQGKVIFFKCRDFLKSDESNPYYAAAGYVPFIGWLAPLYLREKSELCQKCAKQGLLLSIYIALFLFSVFFVDLFIPRSIKIASFVLIVLTYIVNIGYMAISVSGMYHAVYGRTIRIPVVTDRTDKLVL
jgi:uncharacterized membrane protein